MKLVINPRFGGFSISRKCAEFMAERGHEPSKEELKKHPGPGTGLFDWYGYYMDEDRSNPLLIEAVEALGPGANGYCADLKIIEIPDGVEYVIQEYDGSEWVAEKHRTWR